ncbi:MAG: hypothetical protein M9960_03035 [Xanthomonadaceae bacterium]|nr:hypothetical protein [Xanthomonadaceae bacterium]
MQFDPEALKTSIARLVALEPERAFLTHFGAIDHIPQNARSLIEQVDAMSRGALALIDAPDRHAALVAMLDALYVPRAVAHSGLAESAVRDLLGMDIELNAQGLGVWLDRRRRV